MSLGREIRAGDDKIIFLGSKGLTENDGIQSGDVAGAGGQSSHRLHVAEVVGGGERRRSGAVGERIGHGGRWTAIGAKFDQGGTTPRLGLGVMLVGL